MGLPRPAASPRAFWACPLAGKAQGHQARWGVWDSVDHRSCPPPPFTQGDRLHQAGDSLPHHLRDHMLSASSKSTIFSFYFVLRDLLLSALLLTQRFTVHKFKPHPRSPLCCTSSIQSTSTAHYRHSPLSSHLTNTSTARGCHASPGTDCPVLAPSCDLLLAPTHSGSFSHPSQVV
jgi:hypothetical protein